MPEASGYGFGVGVTGAGLFLLPSDRGDARGRPARRGARRARGLEGAAPDRHRVRAASASSCSAVAHDAAVADRRWRWRSSASGIGISFASMANLIVEAVPQHQTGEATGMNTIMRTVGGAFGAQIAATIITEPLRARDLLPDRVRLHGGVRDGGGRRGRGLRGRDADPGPPPSGTGRNTRVGLGSPSSP